LTRDTNLTEVEAEQPATQVAARQPLKSSTEDETDQPAAPVARRQSLRSAKTSRPSKPVDNPFVEPKPRATRKRALRSVDEVQPAQNHSDDAVPTSQLQAAQPSRMEPDPQPKRPRGNSDHTDQKATDVSVRPKIKVPLVGTRPCQDILRTNDHRLVRKPFSARQYVSGVGGHDLMHSDNPLHTPSYVTDIFQRLYDAEVGCHVGRTSSLIQPIKTFAHIVSPLPQIRTRPFPYMDRREPELNGSMRAILVDWLVEVHMKFRLLPETLYLCVNILDRYLAMEPVVRNRLQLVGVTSLLIACKYEEIYPPEVRDCVYITDRAYTRQEVLDMEAAIVKSLEFVLTVPTGYPFLQRFLHITKATLVVRHLANYYMERMLQEHASLAFKPSLLAAASICLAINHPDRREHDDDFDENEIRASIFVSDFTWIGDYARHLLTFCFKPGCLLEYSGYTERDIREAASLIEQKVGETHPTHRRRQLVAVKQKFQSAGYGQVSSIFSVPRLSHLGNPT